MDRRAGAARCKGLFQHNRPMLSKKVGFSD
jgi:hypothetical protein